MYTWKSIQLCLVPSNFIRKKTVSSRNNKRLDYFFKLKNNELKIRVAFFNKRFGVYG